MVRMPELASLEENLVQPSSHNLLVVLQSMDLSVLSSDAHPSHPTYNAFPCQAGKTGFITQSPGNPSQEGVGLIPAAQAQKTQDHRQWGLRNLG